jgi:hypothetical protein
MHKTYLSMAVLPWWATKQNAMVDGTTPKRKGLPGGQLDGIGHHHLRHGDRARSAAGLSSIQMQNFSTAKTIDTIARISPVLPKQVSAVGTVVSSTASAGRAGS